VVRYYNTGIKVFRSQWSGERVVNRLDMSQLNERLSIMVRNVNRYINECIEQHREVTFERIGVVVGQQGDADEWLSFVHDRAEKRKVSAGTRKRYTTLLNVLEDYGRLRQFADLTTPNIIAFDEWLRADARRQDGAVYNYHKCMKAMIADAILLGKMNESPYSRLPKGYIPRGDKESVEFLTESELAAIESVELPDDYLCRARDMFVFQAYSGMAYSDMQSFRLEDCEVRDGLYTYAHERQKTGVPFFTVLWPQAVEIAQRYGGQLPQVCNADYNRYLKAVGAAANVKKRMHSHLARHTFATMMLLKGSALTNVSKMLGHTNTIQTQRYAKTLEESILGDARRMIEKEKRPSQAASQQMNKHL
jgi:integrase